MKEKLNSFLPTLLIILAGVAAGWFIMRGLTSKSLTETVRGNDYQEIQALQKSILEGD
jgi:uncharacterized protein YneF (UPF0154 family)